VNATLEFFRGLDAEPRRQPVDVDALVGSVADDRRDIGVVVAGGTDFGEVVVADAAAFRVHGQRESEGGGDPLVVGVARAVVLDLVRVDSE